MLIFLGARCEINIRKGIQFVEHDIAVVGTDTCRDTGDAFALVLARNGVKLTTLDIALNAAFIEERSHHIHATLVADQYHFIRQMFGANMQVKYAAVLIDNELARWKCLFHRC